MERQTLTVEEAGQLLGIGRTAAYQAARKGELPGALRIGRRIVVSRPALMSLLKADDPAGNGAVDATSGGGVRLDEPD